MTSRRDPLEGRDIIVEFTKRGEFQRVIAVDVESGVEAIATGPLNAPKSDLEHIALGKLTRRLQQDKSPSSDNKTKPRPKGRGLLA